MSKLHNTQQKWIIKRIIIKVLILRFKPRKLLFPKPSKSSCPNPVSPSGPWRAWWPSSSLSSLQKRFRHHHPQNEALQSCPCIFTLSAWLDSNCGSFWGHSSCAGCTVPTHLLQDLNSAVTPLNLAPASPQCADICSDLLHSDKVPSLTRILSHSCPILCSSSQ